MEIESAKSQHMLEDEKILNEIIENADISENEKILEIGAGTGNLTKLLAEKSKEVVSFEVDEKFKEILKEIKNKNKNLEIIFDSCLNYSWTKFDKIIANIPYFLSEAILIKAINSEIKNLVLVVGERLKEKLLGEDKIGLIVKKFYEVKPIIKIEKEKFNPVPRVNSWMIKLEKKKEISELDKMLLEIVLNKGKIKNSIIKSLTSRGYTKNQSRDVLEKLKLYIPVKEKPTQRITAKLLKNIEEELGKELK